MTVAATQLQLGIQPWQAYSYTFLLYVVFLEFSNLLLQFVPHGGLKLCFPWSTSLQEAVTFSDPLHLSLQLQSIYDYHNYIRILT